jgi:hypothetical protein
MILCLQINREMDRPTRLDYIVISALKLRVMLKSSSLELGKNGIRENSMTSVFLARPYRLPSH